MAAPNTPDDTRTADSTPPDVGIGTPPGADGEGARLCRALARSLARQMGAKRRRRRAMASSGAKGPMQSASTANAGDDDDDEKEADVNGGLDPETESRVGMDGGAMPGAMPGAAFARAASRSSQYAGATGRNEGG